jgi:ABC-2 type transport system ATP-binding protein
VSIIRAGRTVESAPLAELRGARQTLVTAELAGPADSLDAIPGLHDLTVQGSTVRCRVDAEHLNDALQRLTTVGVRTITSGPPSLEELFLQHYQTGRVAAGTAGVGR